MKLIEHLKQTERFADAIEQNEKIDMVFRELAAELSLAATKMRVAMEIAGIAQESLKAKKEASA